MKKKMGWGGKRKGAGGVKKPDAGVSHRRRPRFSDLPVHVILQMLPEISQLWSRRCVAALEESFEAGDERNGLKLRHYFVDGEQLHLLVDAENTRALTRGIQGLTIRTAKAINRAQERRGKIFGDRFHSELLRTPADEKRVLAAHAWLRCA